MSAATRESARTAEVARHYLRLLGSERTALAFGLTVGLALLCSMATRGFEGIAATLWLMLFYPLLQWGPADRRGGLDEAMPLGKARHHLVRVACGAAWAAAALAVSVTLVALLFYTGYQGHPGTGFWWYPALILGFGLAFDLFGAAAWLRGETGGMPLTLAVCALAILPFVLLDERWSRLVRLLSLREPPAPGEAWAWIGVMMLWLAAGAAAAWLCASAARWLPWLQARRARAAVREGVQGPGGALPLPVVRPAVTDAPRRPARLHRVLWREIVLLAPKLGSAALLIALLVTMPADTDGERWTRLDHFAFLLTGLLPVWWPVAVWELGKPARRRVEPLPVGALTQRLVRLAAGAVWLELVLLLVLAAPAVGIGAWIPLLDPGNASSWAGLLAGTLLLYLLASLPALLGTEHRLALYLGWIVFLIPVMPLMHSTLPHSRFSLGSALSAVARETGTWPEAMVPWTVVVTAVAVVTAAWGVANERSAPSRLR
ncbi:MAG: hypothetical protein ACJ8J0_11870 [Longimicrobiaceae bacterium]